SDKIPPTKKAMIDPAPPIKLIIPFASLRKGEGATSGINEITGLLHKAMTKLKPMTIVINAHSTCCKDTKAKKKEQIGNPIAIHGIRSPIRVRVLSLHAPIRGWKITPKKLSIVIIAPITVLLSKKRCSNIKGTCEL